MANEPKQQQVRASRNGERYYRGVHERDPEDSRHAQVHQPVKYRTMLGVTGSVLKHRIHFNLDVCFGGAVALCSELQKTNAGQSSSVRYATIV